MKRIQEIEIKGENVTDGSEHRSRWEKKIMSDKR